SPLDGCGVQRRAIVEFDVVAQGEGEFACFVLDTPLRGQRWIELLVGVHRNQRIEDVVDHFERGRATQGCGIDVVDLVPHRPGNGAATAWRAWCRPADRGRARR